jgi:hypothetical protein
LNLRNRRLPLKNQLCGINPVTIYGLSAAIGDITHFSHSKKLTWDDWRVFLLAGSSTDIPMENVCVRRSRSLLQ